MDIAPGLSRETQEGRNASHESFVRFCWTPRRSCRCRGAWGGEEVRREGLPHYDEGVGCGGGRGCPRCLGRPDPRLRSPQRPAAALLGGKHGQSACRCASDERARGPRRLREAPPLLRPQRGSDRPSGTLLRPGCWLWLLL